jgi:hypothetical protein
VSDTGRHCRPIRSSTYAERSVTWRRTITNPLPTIVSARAISIHEATVGDDGVPVPVSGRALTGACVGVFVGSASGVFVAVGIGIVMLVGFDCGCQSVCILDVSGMIAVC